MEQRWFLCSLCAIGLAQTLNLRVDPMARPVEKDKCRMCNKNRLGNYYIVNYKTKGDSRNA